MYGAEVTEAYGPASVMPRDRSLAVPSARDKALVLTKLSHPLRPVAAVPNKIADLRRHRHAFNYSYSATVDKCCLSATRRNILHLGTVYILRCWLASLTYRAAIDVCSDL